MSLTKLQLALDAAELDEALFVLDDVQDLIDICEVGTPFLLRYGVEAVRRIRRRFPRMTLLCDSKIMDAGAFEASAMFDAGADWVTVMAFPDEATIGECVSAAHAGNGRVMADLLCIRDIPSKCAQLERLNVDCIAVHTGVDMQKLGCTPLGDLKVLCGCAEKAMTAVAGGISPETVDGYLALRPDILIVGSGILNQRDKRAAAEAIRSKILHVSGGK